MNASRIIMLLIAVTIICGICLGYTMFQKEVWGLINNSIVPTIQRNPFVALTGISATATIISLFVALFRKLSTKVTALTSENQQSQVNNMNLSTQLQKSVANNDQLASQLTNLTAEKQKLQNTVELLSSQSTDLNSKIAEMVQRIKELEELKL